MLLLPPVTTERKAAVMHRSQLRGNLLSLFAKSGLFAEVADGKSILAKQS